MRAPAIYSILSMNYCNCTRIYLIFVRDDSGRKQLGQILQNDYCILLSVILLWYYS